MSHKYFFNNPVTFTYVLRYLAVGLREVNSVIAYNYYYFFKYQDSNMHPLQQPTTQDAALCQNQ